MLVRLGRIILALRQKKPDAESLATEIQTKIDRDFGGERSHGRRGLAIQDTLTGRIVDLPKGYIRLLNFKLLFEALQRKTMNTCKRIYVDSPLVEHLFASRLATAATENRSWVATRG